MAIEKELKTRIQLKYDSFSEWSKNNPELKSGEVAIAYLTTVEAVAPAQGDTQHPVLFKVGPGHFNDLPWASALAADVHTWAKKNEADFTAWVKTLVTVADIDAYSKGEVDAKFTANSAADQKYAKDYADSLAGNYDAVGTAQTLIEGLDVTDTAVTGKYVSAVSEVDGKVVVSREDLPVYTLTSGSANGTVAFNGADVAVTGLGSAAFTDAKAYDAAGAASEVNNALEAYKTLNDAAVSAADAKGAQGISDAAAALAKANEKTTMAEVEAKDYATKAQAQAMADSKDGAIVAAKASGDKAQEDLVAYITSNNAAVALKASQADFEAEIARAQAAEKANSDAIALLVDSTEGDSVKLNSIKELATWIEEHGGDAAEMTEAISDNAKAIAAEVKRAGEEEVRLAGLIGNNSDAIADEIERADAEEKRLAGLIADNSAAIQALNAADGKVANAGHADVAAKADTADALGGIAADQYALKTDAQGYANAAEAAAKKHADDKFAGYYTKSEADAAFMDATETGNAIDTKITALNLASTYEPIGAENRAKAYADGLAGNYATAAQGAKADSALQNIEVGTGLKVSEKANNKQTIEIDTDVVFVFNCGSSSVLVD